MASVINTNTLSMVTQQNLNQSQNALNTSMERLSSGMRINSAKDDAAGQAIANRMDSQITGLSQAQRNANDGISVAQTAEGALNQVNDNLQRVRELTVQAQNGTNNAEDLQSIQDEITLRMEEIDRISEQTSFNGVDVLNTDDSLSIQVGANDGETISIKLQQTNKSTLGLDTFDVTQQFDVALSEAITENDADGAIAPSGGTLHEVLDNDGEGTGTYVIKDTNGELFATEDTFNIASSTAAGIKTTADSESVDQKVKYSTDGEYVTLSGSNGAVNVAVADVASVDAADTAEVDELEEFDGEVGQTSTTDLAQANPLDAIDKALAQVDSQRSALGAVQNRFDSAITNLATTETNLASAQSRIQDADYAEEVSSMTTAQILQQAGTSMLTQANQVPQNVLSLLG
ncbi:MULTISPECIES: FliC/FljB family flagellin [unclassified Cobetia]|uniref:FliC/FljB family flagellin n=1 Tax=unclassified Cobetia TaxID=2609414 RepID=UPI0020981F91|nr:MULTISPECIES: FliC/FljB family flagellin [unclassified Cobetia]MCO7233162.1 FliC/FljB family flagellin [Cobetia sp. Dlab-2-AX]MCO7236436.1 FliC/FljB family flagellin [Cobetia sp. Dlab-2-U]